MLSLLTAILLLQSGVCATLDPIVIKGSKFFYQTNGTQFYIKGVAYQSGISSNGTVGSDGSYNDPLADADSCKRDIPYLQMLGTNLIRTYAIDPTKDHSQCMSMLDSAGIYVISDLGEPSTSINRADPTWDTTLYTRYTGVIDTLANYSNVVGFFAGNEVTNNASYTSASAFVKAAVRDTKAYITSKGYRAMGVGYAADDDPSIRQDVSDYLNCGDDSVTIDFWGYNIYSWCGDSDFVTSQYNLRTEEFANYSVPVFFAEYGCDQVPGGAANRPFTEVGTLFGPQMNDVFSGGIVYEYYEETNDYGLVTIQADSSVSTLADFNSLSSQIQSVTVTGVNSASYTPTNTAKQACPTVDSIWQASTDLPPTPNENLCDCMMETLTCTAKSSLSDEQVGDLFGEVCGYNGGKACVAITTDTANGTYGQYSMCNSIQRLSYAFNAYHQEQNTNQACDFAGSAQLAQSASATGTCSSVLSQASASASSGGSGGGSGSGSSSSASSSTKKKNAADSVTVGASLGIGKACLAIYVTIAVLSGAGMIIL